MSPRSPHLAFPFRIAPDGRGAVVDSEGEHIGDELAQLVLTNLGERWFQPDLGTNVRRMVYENVDDTATGLTKATISQAAARWLGDRVKIDEVEVRAADGVLDVYIRYRARGSEAVRTLHLQRTRGPR